MSHDPLATEPCPISEALIRYAESLYLSRRARAEYFDSELFAEPAWDMLLDLFVFEAKGIDTLATALSMGAAVPLTTGLRWIGVLERRGYVERGLALKDRRCSPIKLTSKGRDAMTAYLLDAMKRRFPANRQVCEKS